MSRGADEATVAGAEQRFGAVVRVNDARGARALVAEILRADRDYPIIGLTCRPGTRDPALTAESVRERVWDTVPIYVIEPRESRIINDALPKDLGAYNGAARVWWPGVDADAEPSWHPLIFDSSRRYGPDVLDRLAHEFTTALPGADSDRSPREVAAVQLRSVPRPPSTTGTSHGAELVPLATKRDARRLASELRRADRPDLPVVVLTPAETAAQSPFSEAVAALLDRYIPVYVLASAELSRRLRSGFGDELAVAGGDARVYWPPVMPNADPRRHPLVPAESHEDQRPPGDRLLSALELSRPTVRAHVWELQSRLAEAQAEGGARVRELRTVRGEVAEVRSDAERLASALAQADERLQAIVRAGVDEDELLALVLLDDDAVLQRLISREWLTSMEPADRFAHPLGPYRFGPTFAASVERRRNSVPPSRVAFACAMVACRRARESAGLEPHTWRSGKESGSGDDAQHVRADGGKGWICNLGHGRGAARLLYWSLPDGLFEFHEVRTHDQVGARP